jgi:hypothetical protein
MRFVLLQMSDNQTSPNQASALGALTSASRSLKVNFCASCFLLLHAPSDSSTAPSHLPFTFCTGATRDHPIGRLRFSVAERKYKCSIRAGCAFFRLRRRCHMSGTYHCDSDISD